MFCLLVGLERVSRRKDEQRFPSSLYGLERTLSMGSHVFAEGSRVRVITYSPFRGLKGMIRIVHRIAPRVEDPFCFYQIELEGAQVKEPIWFASEEVELLASHEDLFLISDSTASDREAETSQHAVQPVEQSEKPA